MTDIVSMERAIHIVGKLLAFLTMIILRLGALFIPWLAVLVGGTNFAPAMSSVVSARSQCLAKVSRFAVSGLKP